MVHPKDDSYPTRPSLLVRLKDTGDQQSWQEFNDLYGKLIFGFAIKAGLTETEAQEVVQQTLIAAAKNLPEFRYDPKVCSFKTWLLNLSRWRVTDQLRKRLPGLHKPASPDDATSRTATICSFVVLKRPSRAFLSKNSTRISRMGTDWRGRLSCFSG